MKRKPYRTSEAVKAMAPAPPKRQHHLVREQSAWIVAVCDPTCKRDRNHFGPCLPFTLEDVAKQPSGRPLIYGERRFFPSRLMCEAYALADILAGELEPLPLIGSAMQRLVEP